MAHVTATALYSAADRAVTVDLAADVHGHEARVEVRDAGPGIPAKEQDRIWERYQRVQGIEVQSGTGVGLGLGLPISRAIIEQHQRQVGVQSTPGQGSTFWFSLPLAPPEPALGRYEEDPPEGWLRYRGQQSNHRHLNKLTTQSVTNFIFRFVRPPRRLSARVTNFIFLVYITAMAAKPEL